MDRRLHDLLERVPGLVNPDWHPTISHGISRRVATVLSPPLRGPVFAPTRLGFDLCVDETCGNPYWRLGEYELGTLGLIRRVLAQGGTFVDIGASVGQMSLFAAIQPSATRVLAFEPHTTRFRYLSLGVQRAGVNNVDTFPFALGDVNGTGYLRSDLVSPSMVGASPQCGANQIEVRRLDDVLADASVRRVDLIKLDVEGAELEVILGAKELLSSDEAPVICFEHGVGRHDDGVANSLRELNDYRLYRFKYGQNADDALVPLDEIVHAHSGENVVACTPAHMGSLPEIQYT